MKEHETVSNKSSFRTNADWSSMERCKGIIFKLGSFLPMGACNLLSTSVHYHFRISNSNFVFPLRNYVPGKSDRSRRELTSVHWVAKFGLDTAESEWFSFPSWERGHYKFATSYDSLRIAFFRIKFRYITRQFFSSSSHSNGPTFSSFLVRSFVRCARKRHSKIMSDLKG